MHPVMFLLLQSYTENSGCGRQITFITERSEVLYNTLLNGGLRKSSETSRTQFMLRSRLESWLPAREQDSLGISRKTALVESKTEHNVLQKWRGSYSSGTSASAEHGDWRLTWRGLCNIGYFPDSHCYSSYKGLSSQEGLYVFNAFENLFHSAFSTKF